MKNYMSKITNKLVFKFKQDTFLKEAISDSAWKAYDNRRKRVLKGKV